MAVTPSEAAATLRRREAEENARAEAHAETTLARLRGAMAGFLAPGERAWLIGSLAWGGFGVRSDVDLVCDGISSERLLALEHLVTTTTGAAVDLLDLEALTPSFRDRVLGEGLSLP